MKKNLWLIPLIMFHFFASGQDYTFQFKNFTLSVPLYNNTVKYSKIIDVDTVYSDKIIFSSLKSALSNYWIKPGITHTDLYKIFKLDANTAQIINSDETNYVIDANFLFETKRKPADPDFIKDDIYVFCNCRLMVKNGKVKIIFTQPKFYNYSIGMAIAFGASTGMIYNDIDKIIDMYITNKIRKTDYEVKRCMSVLYKLDKTIPEDFKSDLDKYLKMSVF